MSAIILRSGVEAGKEALLKNTGDNPETLFDFNFCAEDLSRSRSDDSETSLESANNGFNTLNKNNSSRKQTIGTAQSDNIT